jgi:hypothetical protein
MKTPRTQLAIEALREAQSGFSKIEDDARRLLCLVLDKYGEKGIYIPDYEPGEFVKIDRIRYWKGRLQVKAEGQWIDYEYAMADTWFMIDTLIYVLENKEES